MHDCACCGHAVYALDPLCDECQTADCQPNREGVYDSCEVDGAPEPEHWCGKCETGELH